MNEAEEKDDNVELDCNWDFGVRTLRGKNAKQSSSLLKL